MAQRKQLGLFFSYNENWIGGTYYILNLVHALNLLEDDVKPFITIIGNCESDYEYIKKESSYPYLAFLQNKSGKTLWRKVINAFSLRILKRELISPKLQDKFDLLFPAFAGSEYLSLIDDTKKIDWIPDFQDFHLPQLYTPKTLVEVRQRNLAKAYLSNRIVLSSEDAAKDFRLQYPDSKAEVHVVPFSVTHPDFSNLNFDNVRTKYQITGDYFYAPNQYWVHKNHQLVIKAVKKLKDNNKNILVLFSGKEWDPRNPEYVPMLKKQVEELGLHDNIRFLGFLDRNEQLLIMKNAKAIIQPSLFEGWSTVIEDAKALNKFVFAANLAVNKEQLAENVVFFDPSNVSELAEKLLMIEINIRPIDYNNSRREQAKKFMDLF
jgi:glycosyltransferase involved in cell wall biosynthesis